MIRTIAATVLALCCTAASASAAVVGFVGTVTTASSSSGLLGTIPPNRSFIATFTITDGAGPTGPITSGNFNFAGGPFVTVNGGSVTINSILNQIQYTAGPTAPATLSNFTFTVAPGLLSGNAVSQAQLDRAIGTTTSFSFTDLGTFINYTGTITAVPEPGSVLALTGLVVGIGGWRLRRRMKKAEATE